MYQTNKTSNSLAASALLIVIMLTAGCGMSPDLVSVDEKIIGKWTWNIENQYERIKVEFFEDNTIELRTVGDKVLDYGSWRLLDDETIKMELWTGNNKDGKYTIVGKIYIKDGEITIVEKSGDVLTLRRAN